MKPKRQNLKGAFLGLAALSERAKVHLQPVHYYSDIPDRRWLRRNKSLWAKPMLPIGQRWDLDAQLRWLEERCAPYLDEVKGFADFDEDVRADFGPGYGPIEAQVLHCVMRHQAPARVVEVGSGVSTATMLRAIDRNTAEGRTTTAVTCIEPNPGPGLRRLDVELVVQPAQAVDLDVFLQLDAGDLLFIDSTHAVRTGSEVIRLYLEVLPRLRPGVLVHIHDIFLPYVFHPNVLDFLFDWQETALLAALLTGNDALEVLTCLSALTIDRPRQLQEILPDLHPRHLESGVQVSEDGDYPSSIWLCTR